MQQNPPDDCLNIEGQTCTTIDMHDYPVRDLIRMVRKIPSSICHLVITNACSWDEEDLNACSESDITKILSAIPHHVSRLSLGEPVGQHSFSDWLFNIGRDLTSAASFNLISWPSSKRTRIFAAIPRTICHLDLARAVNNEESLYKGELQFRFVSGDLQKSFRALPPMLEHLDLSYNHFDILPAGELAIALKALPTKIKSLNLTEIFTRDVPEKEKNAKLLEILKSLPENLTELNLSSNRLGCIEFYPDASKDVLVDCFANLPKSLKKINLSYNNLCLISRFSLLLLIPTSVDEIIIKENKYHNYLMHTKVYTPEELQLTKPLLSELDTLPNARQRYKFNDQLQAFWQTLPLPLPNDAQLIEPHAPKILPTKPLEKAHSISPFLLKCLAGITIDAILLLLIAALASPPIALAVGVAGLLLVTSVSTYRFFCTAKPEAPEKFAPQTMKLC